MDRILIASDDAGAAAAMAATAETLGMSVVIATDGMEAFDIAVSDAPLLAIVSPGLAIYDGYELAAMLRDSPDVQPKPEVWLLTSLATDVRRLEKCGISGVIAPGQAISDLREKIGGLIRGQ